MIEDLPGSMLVKIQPTNRKDVVGVV